MADLLQPKPFAVKDQNGKERNYIMSKFPAVLGREIVSKYPLSAMPKIGDYAVNEETMLKLMAHVGVEQKNGDILRLSTRALVDNHVPDWETLAHIEIEMMQYNCSFFLRDRALTFLDALIQKVSEKITGILTPSSPPSSRMEKPLSMN